MNIQREIIYIFHSHIITIIVRSDGILSVSIDEILID